MQDQNSFRATRHAPTVQRNTTQYLSFHIIISYHTAMKRNMFPAIVGGWPGETLTLELLGSSSRTLTVPMNQCPFKASRRVRTTLIHHATLGIEGVPALLLSPSAAWDSLYIVLSMVCQGGDASRVQLVPTPLSHVHTSSTLNPRTPCTLGRLDAGLVCERGVPGLHGCETSIPQPLKYIPLSFVLFSLVGSEVSYASI